MHVRLYNIEGQHYIATTLSPGRLVWASYTVQRILTEIDPPGFIGEAYHVSADGTRVVTADDGPHGIDIWELPSGKHLQHCPGRGIYRLFWDPTGRYLAILHPR